MNTVNTDYAMWSSDETFRCDRAMFVVVDTDDVSTALARVDALLPENYRSGEVDTYEGVLGEGRMVVVVNGADVSGWTAEGYVIPRLATGGIVTVYRSWSPDA